jgi:hypothetical protein
MPAIKITGFLGTAPKISPELLPPTAAQVAENCKLYSGDLIPFPVPHIVASTNRSGTIRTLYALRNPTSGSLVWLSWLTDVSIVTPATDELGEQRFYYTGDGNAKVSTYALATNGSAPYPSTTGYYDLGLPLPSTVLTTVATPFTAITTGSFSRDNANNVTVTTTGAHNLKDGASISVSGLTPTTFNVVTTATVISSTSFSYYAVGPAGTTTGGTIDLGGSIQARTYLYTWYTPWNEESIGSEPSTPLFIKEGQIVTVTGLPTAPPSGNNFVRGIRLYRTLSGTTSAEYYRLQTLWFPNTVTRVARSNNVVTITLQYPHNLIAEDRFKIGGCSDATFNGTGSVLEVIDTNSFTYSQTASDVASKTVTGTMYYDIAESLSSTARYWGDGGSYTFTDDFNFRSLTEILTTSGYAPPPDNIKGLKVVQNTFLAGFVGNSLYFSEPNEFHAWPEQYKISFESSIVGIAVIGQEILVLTESYPYVVSGNDPSVLSIAKLPSRYPCVSARSIVETSSGIVWATHDGLALWSSTSGAPIITRQVHSSDTWNAALDPSTLVGVSYKETYFASHSAGSIVFEAGAQGGATSFVNSDFKFTATWYDSLTNILYVSSGTNGDVYHWDDPNQPTSQIIWKSKVFKVEGYTNVGAARVIADYATNETPYEWATAAVDWELAEQIWNSDDPITFKLYVNKELKIARICTDSDAFRLPSGYKSDTFEVEVESYIRVRAIQLGDTPLSLRDV